MARAGSTCLPVGEEGGRVCGRHEIPDLPPFFKGGHEHRPLARRAGVISSPFRKGGVRGILHTSMLPYKRRLKQPSRRLRNDPTDAEEALWAKVRRGQLNGCQFYRQKPIGEYIVDFWCPAARLVVEVDGSQHLSDEGIQHDKVRAEYLASLGLRVVRFTNIEVLTSMESVLQAILEHMREQRKDENPP